MDDTMIRAVSVTRYFGPARALDSLSFTLAKGSRTALLGPNGAGKSTLLKIICGALPPDGGGVTVLGKNPSEQRRVPGFLGWLPERAPLNAELTVLEHLELTARFRGLDKKRAKGEIERLSEALDLGSKLARLTGRLSLGTRRQAALAVALMGDPELVVLDEPSSSLDPDEVGRLNSLVQKLPHGTTLIISSHILPEARSLTDSAMIIGDGALKAMGPWEILGGGGASPEEAYFKALGGR
jgi:ABC-2 type transport system ATP-binding protein